MARLFAWLPIGRATAAWWAWKNRRELGRWLRFAVTAVPRSAADREDLLVEGRLRAALARDARTRGVPSLAVRVEGGIASLRGHLAPATHDLATALASGTRGVRRVDCRIRDKGRRRTPIEHAHETDVAPLPPVPPMPR